MKKIFFLCTFFAFTINAQEDIYRRHSTEQRQKIATHFFNILMNAFVAASHKDDKATYTTALTRALENLSHFIQLLVTKNKNNNQPTIDQMLIALEQLSHDQDFLELLEQELTTSHFDLNEYIDLPSVEFAVR